MGWVVRIIQKFRLNYLREWIVKGMVRVSIKR